MGKKFHHFTLTDRLCIERKLKEKKTPKQIAELLGVHISSIYRELERGQCVQMNSDLTTETRYSPETAERRYRENLAAKGAPLKIGADRKFADYIEEKIVKGKYSPAAALHKAEEEGKATTKISKATLYSYIEKGVFLTLTIKHLPVKGTKKKRYRTVSPARAPRGESIEKRPKEIESHEEWGHWEMDCVEGKKGTKETLLVLTERTTRQEIIRKMADQTAASVVKTLDGIEHKFGEMFKTVFKSITVDNGSEFSDCTGMERSALGEGARTKVYYCHPYSAYERGSNENQNKLIRRHFPKGFDFREVTAAAIEYVEDWVNNYLRELLGWKCSAALFWEYLCKIQQDHGVCFVQ